MKISIGDANQRILWRELALKDLDDLFLDIAEYYSHLYLKDVLNSIVKFIRPGWKALSIEEKQETTNQLAEIINTDEYLAGIRDETVKPEIDALGPIVKVQCLLNMLAKKDL